MNFFLINKKIITFRDFMKKHNLATDTVNESELQRNYNYPFHPSDGKIYSDKYL